MSVYLGNKLVSPQGGITTDPNALQKDFTELTALPQSPASSDLLAIRSGNSTYKVSYQDLAEAVPNLGDGTFESIETNVNAGTGTVKIQRYGKMRFLFVDFKPSITGVDLLVAVLDPSDTPSEAFYIGVSSYNGDRTCVFHVYSNGNIAMDLATNPNDYLRGTAAFMVP